MRTPTTAIAGCVVLLVAVAGFWGTTYWVESRTLRAVDMPVSLARGTIKTGPFRLNVHGFYSIVVMEEKGGPPACNVDLEMRRISSIGGLPVYRYQWLEDEGRSIGRNTIPGRFVGGFQGMPGIYHLEIEVVSDTACLNVGNPRLYVLASINDIDEWNQRYENWCGLMVFIGLLGFVLLVASMIVRERSDAKRNPSIF